MSDIKDSQGNILSQQQIDYFKNSKVRDENGNLLVCYHGTYTPGFKEFNPRQAKSQFGKYKFERYNVNYFTSDKYVATTYTELGIEEDDNVLACYINITNPFIVDNKTEAEYRTWGNIKDERIRDREIAKFEAMFEKWQRKGADIRYLNEINKDLFSFNCELRPNEEDEELFDLVYLGNNTLYGSERIKMYQYNIEDFFSDYVKNDLRDELVGDYVTEYDDYLHSTDDIIRWVITMNEEDNTSYDGIIVKDILDVGPRGTSLFSRPTTDIITLESSNQIKLISNTHPTEKSLIDESRKSGAKLEDIEMSKDTDSAGNLLSKEQVEFFKNSKIRDKRGRLLVCYHGTSLGYTKKPFEIFNKNMFATGNGDTDFGEGFYFTPIRKEAQAYADAISIDDEFPAFIFDVYLNIKNPLNISTKPKDLIPMFKHLGITLSDGALEEINDANDVWSNWFAGLLNKIYGRNSSKEFTKTLINNGYDGVIFEDEIVAFDENQIKAITNKQPTKSKNINEELEFDDYYDLYKNVLDKDATYYIDDDIKNQMLEKNERYDWLDDYKFAIVDLEEVIKKNHLDNPEHEMFSKHLDVWPSDRELYHYKFEKEDWLYSPIRIYPNLTIKDGNHRLWALYNDGYKYAEVLMQKPINLKEELLLEKSRNDLIAKARAGKAYKNQSKGKNRWERKKYSRVANATREYNSIDMNTFFKKDILNVVVPVHGETDDYKVKIRFNGVLKELREIIKRNNNKLDYRTISQALSRVFNSENIYVWCTCKDWEMRFNYWSKQNDFNAGTPNEQAPWANRFEWTNKYDDMGGICKHVALVIANLSWLMKVASVINNYIHFAEENMQRQFADIIFPKLYGTTYPKAVQLGMFDRQYLKHSKGVIDSINEYGSKRGRFKATTKEEEKPVFSQTPKQLSIFDEEEVKEDVFDKPGFKQTDILEEE